MARKSISKKIRFDVFKRDGFKCQYCGQNPPSVILELDHIIPVARKGMDAIDNLITSCFDCNRGKRDSLLTDLPKTVREKAFVMAEAELQLHEFNKIIRRKQRRENSDIDQIQSIFSKYFPNRIFGEPFRNSIRTNFLPFINVDELESYMAKACDRMNHNQNKAIRYFCGICWNIRRGSANYGKE